VLKKNNFLLISVLLHLIVICVVAQSVMFPSVTYSPAKKPDIIQARMIFDLPPTPEIPVEIIKEETPEPIDPEKELPVAETPVDSPIESVSKPIVTVISAPPQIVPPKREEEQPDINDELDEISITKQNITPTMSSEVRAPMASMARRHLSSFQQQQRNKVAEQASKYYQQHKNSPVIDNQLKNSFVTEGEKFRDSLKVRADCSSTSKKSTAVFLGFLGAQIDCTKPPPISSFIQNRINKEPLSSALRWQEDKKRPLSIVIKEQP
jgi:hypothetical protein